MHQTFLRHNCEWLTTVDNSNFYFWHNPVSSRCVLQTMSERFPGLVVSSSIVKCIEWFSWNIWNLTLSEASSYAAPLSMASLAVHPETVSSFHSSRDQITNYAFWLMVEGTKRVPKKFYFWWNTLCVPKQPLVVAFLLAESLRRPLFHVMSGYDRISWNLNLVN